VVINNSFAVAQEFLRPCLVYLYNAAVTGSSSTTYTYNGNGGTASESEVINSNTFLTSYTYNRAGSQVLITYPDSAQVQYSYNTAGQLEKVQTKESGGSFGDVVSNFDYNPMGQVITQTDVNGVATANTYDATKLYRLTNRTTTKTSNGTKHQDLTFTYDNNGNITQLVDASNTNSAKTGNYVYDDLNRLTSSTITGAASGGNYTHTASYDALGNISSKSDIGTYLYQGSSGSNYANPHAATSINGTTYTYDTNGNMTGNGTFANTWDYKNQLSQTTNSSSTVSFYYDHEGNRGRYTVGATTFYTPNRYYQKKGTTLDKYVFAGDNLVAIIETKTAVTPRYVHLDQLNSTAIVTNGSGNQVQLTDYYPYGQVRQNTLAGSFDSRKKYATHELDDDTGFDYVKARYYLGDRGRFESQDRVFLMVGTQRKELENILIDPQLLNSYSYAKNNPTTLEDVNGNNAVYAAAMGAYSGLVVGASYSVASQIISNVNNGSQGINILNINYSDLAKSGFNGAIIGGISGIASYEAAELLGKTGSVLAPSLIAGTISFGESIIDDKISKRDVNIPNATQNALNTIVTTSLLQVGVNLNVTGRLPNVFSKKFFNGVHANYEVGKELLNKTVGGVVTTYINGVAAFINGVPINQDIK
jgi:RHS repeat-associated protein